MYLAGERIANIRQAFNVREGINPVSQPALGRVFGDPPLADGPTSGVKVQIESMTREYLDEMGWTQDAAVPTRETLARLGLKQVAEDLWGAEDA
jgi:aldehyde:ferredoxin oxidoreductase